MQADTTLLQSKYYDKTMIFCGNYHGCTMITMVFLDTLCTTMVNEYGEPHFTVQDHYLYGHHYDGNAIFVLT